VLDLLRSQGLRKESDLPPKSEERGHSQTIFSLEPKVGNFPIFSKIQEFEMDSDFVVNLLPAARI
jgi:hypothetical protein